jgi:hypothetical protein
MEVAKVGRVLGKIFFPLALFIFLFAYTLGGVLQPENFSSLVSKTLGQSDSQQLAELANSLREACEGEDTIEVPDRNLSIGCSEVAGKSDQELLLLFAKELVESQTVQYSCGFLECTMQIFRDGLKTENILFFFSDIAREFFEKLMIYSLVAAAVLGAILAVSIKEWKKRFSYFGKTFIGASMPFVIIFFLASRILPSFLPAEISSVTEPIISGLFSSTAILYVGLLVGGIALLLVGRFGFKSKS